MSDISFNRALITTDTVGGVWTFSIELARGLTGRGVEVTLATMGRQMSPAQRSQADAVDGLRLHESVYRLEWMADPWSDVDASAAWLGEICDALDPDLVHLNQYAQGAAQWSAPCVVGAHSCVLSWWRAVRKERAPAGWDAYRDRVAAGLAGANVVAAPTRVMLDAVRENYDYRGPGVVIPNGRRCDSLNIAKKDVILTAGRLWDEAKNVRLVSSIAQDLEWPVYAAGDRGDDEIPGVRLLGQLGEDEMRLWLHSAAIFVLPSRYEPFGLGALEAALAGCALVLGDIPSLREVWDDSAIFVDPDDSAELAGVLRRLIANPDLRREFAERAKARAKRYSVDNMVNGYFRLYERMQRQSAERLAA